MSTQPEGPPGSEHGLQVTRQDLELTRHLTALACDRERTSIRISTAVSIEYMRFEVIPVPSESPSLGSNFSFTVFLDEESSMF